MWELAFRPLAQRLATAIGGALSGAGMVADDVNVVLAAVPVLVGWSIDLLIRRLF